MTSNVMVDEYLSYLQFEQTLQEGLILEKVNIQDSKKYFHKMLDYSKKALKKFNIRPTKFINIGKIIAKDIERGYKNKIPPEKLTKGFIKRFISELKKEADTATLGEKVLFSIAVFLLLFVLNSIILNVGASLLTKFGLDFSTAVFLMIPVVGPLFEEAVKNVFIQLKMPWLGTGVVFGIEAAMYLYRLWKSGTLAITHVIARIMALIFHFYTTAVQKKYIEKHPDKEFAAYLVGFVIHFAWNLIPAISGIVSGTSLTQAGFT
jgi:hypothetical protein